MKYYSATKYNEIIPFATTWMDLEIIILSEISQKDNIIQYHLYVESNKNDTNELFIKQKQTDHKSNLLLPKVKCEGKG